MGKIINLVATDCRPEVEEEFNRWYNEVHVPMLLKNRGLKKVTRYRINGETDGFPSYLAIYEYDNQKDYEDYENGPELTEARADVQETWKDGGLELKWRVQYEEIQTWEK